MDLRVKNKALRAQQMRIEELQKDTEEAFMVSIRLLARAAEVHDEDTGNHIIRCNEYAYLMASKVGMPTEFCDEIHFSAQLHDIGKMSVNSAILTKRGRLDDDERFEMNQHTTYGHQILERSDRLQMAAEIARSHHEQWNGGGYPEALRASTFRFRRASWRSPIFMTRCARSVPTSRRSAMKRPIKFLPWVTTA